MIFKTVLKSTNLSRNVDNSLIISTIVWKVLEMSENIQMCLKMLKTV